MNSVIVVIAFVLVARLLRATEIEIEKRGRSACGPVEEQMKESEKILETKRRELAHQETLFRLFADRCEAVRSFGSSLRFSEAWADIERGSRKLFGSSPVLWLPVINESMPSGIFPKDATDSESAPWKTAREGKRVEIELEEGWTGYWIPLPLGDAGCAVLYVAKTVVVPADAVEIFVNQMGLLLEKIRLYHEVELQSRTDLLTGLPHQAAFKAHLQEEVERARQNDRQLSLIMADVDHFKSVNDTYGHLVGDQVLIQVAHKIRETVRVSDIPTRYGGEEFATLLIATPQSGAREIGERLRAAVEANVMIVRNQSGEEPLNRTISIGCATFPEDASTAAELLERADAALYHAKRNGRNRVVLHQEVHV